jgi:hypothetical protein
LLLLLYRRDRDVFFLYRREDFAFDLDLIVLLRPPMILHPLSSGLRLHHAEVDEFIGSSTSLSCKAERGCSCPSRLLSSASYRCIELLIISIFPSCHVLLARFVDAGYVINELPPLGNCERAYAAAEATL